MPRGANRRPLQCCGVHYSVVEFTAAWRSSPRAQVTRSPCQVECARYFRTHSLRCHAAYPSRRCEGPRGDASTSLQTPAPTNSDQFYCKIPSKIDIRRDSDASVLNYSNDFDRIKIAYRPQMGPTETGSRIGERHNLYSVYFKWSPGPSPRFTISRFRRTPWPMTHRLPGRRRPDHPDHPCPTAPSRSRSSDSWPTPTNEVGDANQSDRSFPKSSTRYSPPRARGVTA